MTLNLSGYEETKTFAEEMLLKSKRTNTNGVLSPSSIHFISKAAGYNEEELEKNQWRSSSKSWRQSCYKRNCPSSKFQRNSLESIGGDLSEDMAKVFTSKDFSGEVKPGGTVRVSGTIQGFENESVLINATDVFPQ